MIGERYAAFIHMSDGHAPIVLRHLDEQQVRNLRSTVEQSATGVYQTAQRQCFGSPHLILGGELVITAHITRVQVVPESALSEPAEDRSTQVGFDLFGAG